jgi:MFS-type transporter involved in bile tolerance (Atg22 family)
MAKGVPDGWAALAVPLIFIGGMAGKLACGFLAERVGIIRTVVITEIATGAGILLTLLLPAAGAFALLPLIGIALNGTSSVLYATIGDLVEHDRLPRAFGFFYAMGAACGIISPLAFGALGDATSVATSMAVVGAMVLLTLPLCLMLAPALRRHAA